MRALDGGFDHSAAWRGALYSLYTSMAAAADLVEKLVVHMVDGG